MRRGQTLTAREHRTGARCSLGAVCRRRSRRAGPATAVLLDVDTEAEVSAISPPVCRLLGAPGMKLVLASLTVACSLGHVDFALASEPVLPPPPAHLVSLDISGEADGASYTVHARRADPDGDPPLARCARSCRVWLPMGEYRVTERSPEGGKNDEVVELHGPRRVRFTETDHTARGIGLAAGVVGPLMMLAGATRLCWDCDREQLSDDEKREIEIGTLLVLGGIAATTAGWIVFAKAGRDVEVSSGSDERGAPPAASWSFAIVPTHRGSFAVGRLTF